MLPAVLALIAAGGGLAWAKSGTTGPTYRTATVTTADVEQLLTLTGTTHEVSQAPAAFPVRGTVTGVAVQIGDSVHKDQILARIDPVPLQRAVIDGTATLARARATLATDETPATSSASTTTSSTPSTTASAARATTTSTASGSRSSSARPNRTSGTAASGALLRKAQQAVSAAAHACGPGSTPNGESPTPTTTATPTDTPGATTSATTSATGAGAGASGSAPSPPDAPRPSRPRSPAAADCSSALQAALKAEQAVAQAQAAAQTAMQKNAASTPPAAKAVPQAALATGTRSASAAAPANSSAGKQGNGGSMSTAARITTDTAAISAAQVALDIADRNLAGATLVAPLAGRVATQPFSVGSNSGSDTILIVAGGAAQVTVRVPVTSVSALKAGQPAAVTADGSTTSVGGAVTQIGLLPTDNTSGSTTTYPVVVDVPQPGAAFVEGGAATVSITVKTVHGLLTVPNSALSDGRVTVLAADKPAITRVQIGAVGALRTQITSGLKLGQQVVLADLSAPLPANSTITNRTFGGFAGGFSPGVRTRGFTGGGGPSG